MFRYRLEGLTPQLQGCLEGVSNWVFINQLRPDFNAWPANIQNFSLVLKESFLLRLRGRFSLEYSIRKLLEHRIVELRTFHFKRAVAKPRAKSSLRSLKVDLEVPQAIISKNFLKSLFPTLPTC